MLACHITSLFSTECSVHCFRNLLNGLWNVFCHQTLLCPPTIDAFAYKNKAQEYQISILLMNFGCPLVLHRCLKDFFPQNALPCGDSLSSFFVAEASLCRKFQTGCFFATWLNFIIVIFFCRIAHAQESRDKYTFLHNVLRKIK